MKRKAGGAIVVRKPGWCFIYFVYDDTGKVIYVGQTVNETKRAAHHQQATSKCRRLAAAIQRLRTTTSTWEFAKNYRRAPGLLYGLPEELADKFEAFFIARVNGTGTLHSTLNPSGCNMREGNNVMTYEPEFDELQTQLDMAVSNGDNLYSESEHMRRRAGVPSDILEAEGDVAIVQSLRKACEDNTGRAPECVEEVYQLVTKRLDGISNVYGTRCKIRELKGAYAPNKKESEAPIDRVDFAKEWNSLGTLLSDFYFEGTNQRQQTCQKLVAGFHKSCRVMFQNGEAVLTAGLSPLTAGEVFDTLRMLETMVKTRDDAGGIPNQSFQSRMAWCLPNSKLKGSLHDNLEKVNALIAEPKLLDDQRAKAVARRDEILKAIEVQAAESHADLTEGV